MKLNYYIQNYSVSFYGFDRKPCFTLELYNKQVNFLRVQYLTYCWEYFKPIYSCISTELYVILKYIYPSKRIW